MDYTKLPIWIICRYLWDLAKGDVDGEDYSSVWDTSLYGSFTPFYPVYQGLGPDTSVMPYVLYDYIFVQPNGTFFPVNKERATLTITGSAPQVFYVKNFIYEALKKFDTSAQEINSHIADADVSFKYITCDQSSYQIDEKSINTVDGTTSIFQTSLILTYEFTKS